MRNDLSEILSIPSVKGQEQNGAPFGIEPRKALDWFLNKAKSFGLRTGELDGYCGWAEYGDPDAECIGVLCHLDIVPAGDGWPFDPYKLTVKDGYLYGRGVVDDKGPTVACMHALKGIKDANLKLKKRIRIIAGCDEESGSACMKHYSAHGEIPLMSIVPDADFPIINSEKGILRLKLHIPKDTTLLNNSIKITGGTTINVVPPSAKLTFPKTSAIFTYFSGISTPNERIFDFPKLKTALAKFGLSKKDYSVICDNANMTIEAHGIAGHAMNPAAADNALWKLFILLNCIKNYFPSAVVDAIFSGFCHNDAPEALGIAKFDEESGALTVSMDIIEDDAKTMQVSLDIRYPRNADKNIIKDTILSKMPSGSTVEILNGEPPLYISKDSAMVQTLLRIYHECTGLDASPKYCGGGTYARRLPNSIAFGPTFPDAVTNIHNIGECISIEQFEKLYGIYYKAMVELANL